jgi:hypothetical protein
MNLINARLVGSGEVVRVAIHAGRIAHVDPMEPGDRRHASDHDAHGRWLMPGFNDAHVHLWKVGNLLTGMLDVRGVLGLAELSQLVAEFAGPLPSGRWFEGRGYNEATLREGRHPTCHDLDMALGERPGLLIRTCAHIAVANSAALRIAGIGRDTQPPPGGIIERDERGEPTGILHETALGLVQRVIPPPTRDDYERMILAGCRHQLALGITSATDPAVFPELIGAYRHLAEQGKLPQRVNLMAIRRPDGGSETYPLPAKIHSDFLRLDTVKFFADGGLSGATAALRRPYRHADTRGVLRFGEEELFGLALEAHRAGFRIGTHAIGDEAIDQVLRVYERLTADGPGLRHRIEHLGLPDDDLLRRMAHGQYIAVPQAIFIDELGQNFRRYIDDEYLARAYPLRRVLDAGITLALSSDAPVVKNDNPLSGIKAAVTRRDREGHFIGADQGITVPECLHAYTMGGAIASGEERWQGSLERGKWADLILLSHDPTRVAPEELDRIKVEAVFVGGELVVH